MRPHFTWSLLLALGSAGLPRAVSAHLMAPGHATVHALGTSVFSVVSLPASALAGVDDNGDGLVSQGELERHHVSVIHWLEERWRLFDGAERAEPVRIDLVLQPADNAPPAQADRADQIVMLHHARFSHVPREIAVETDLFGGDSASTSLPRNAEAVHRWHGKGPVDDPGGLCHRWIPHLRKVWIQPCLSVCLTKAVSSSFRCRARQRGHQVTA